MMTEARPHETEDLNTLIARLWRVLSADHYPAGDRAALKRDAPGTPVPLAFYRLWWVHLDREPPSDIEAWRAIAFGMTYMGPGAHLPACPLGRALAEAGYSENRLEQLLACADDLRLKLFVNAVRFLAAKGNGFNWVEAAQLLLTRDEAKREQIHRRIARDFYRSIPKSNASPSN